jgi:hypothetical protein|tara:strand:+ start:183 stop:794 length:612 start_codon:yes stop_codon:yes gene_type:complete
MKKFLGILVLIFTLQTPSLADDIRDFQIEGMSIGDSLLLYKTKQEINESMKTDYPSSKLYNRFTIRSINSTSLKDYDDVQVHFKTEDKNFVIVSVTGGIYNSNEFDKCLKKKELVIKEISTVVPNTRINDGGISPWLDADSSGKTITSTYYFNFGSKKYNDFVEIGCYDWNQELTDKNGWTDHLKVGLHTKEFNQWLSEEAFK